MRGLQWTSCLVYLDDIVFSRDHKSHLQRLGEVLGSVWASRSNDLSATWHGEKGFSWTRSECDWHPDQPSKN